MSKIELTIIFVLLIVILHFFGLIIVIERTFCLTNFDPHIWTRARKLETPKYIVDLTSSDLLNIQISKKNISDLSDVCKNVRYRTLYEYLTVFPDGVYVSTGDIDDMWLRDSAIQMKPFMSDIRLVEIMEHFVLTQSRMILLDPYANSFRKRWKKPKPSERLRRGGFVATGNWEPDSLAYYLHFLCDVNLPDLFQIPSVAAAINTILNIFEIEQHHSDRSTYRYEELPNNGTGKPVLGFTGLVWGGFRPSDDPQTYGYNIPVNMFIHAALMKLQRKFQDHRIEVLLRDIELGIQQFGIINETLYAYEVDGLGGMLCPYDDANLPNLLSIPYFHYEHMNHTIYSNTRQAILSRSNPNYFVGENLNGVGSPHTPHDYVWPLGVIARGLTSTNPAEIADQFLMLLKMLAGTSSMHESVHATDVTSYTRKDFEWANSMFVEFFIRHFPSACHRELELNRIRFA